MANQPNASIASRNFDGCARWHDQARRVGYCARPVRLAGRVRRLDADTGEWRRLTYSTASEPDGCLLKACGQRRASVCPSCAATYQPDAFQLPKSRGFFRNPQNKGPSCFGA